MAMKTGTSPSLIRPVFDDFEPSTELSENHEAHFLRILLPGFTRDQIRIIFMNVTKMLNVSGEREIDSGNYRWVRFNQSYPIPQNCNEGKLQANFARGVLTITMPKNIPSQRKTEAQQKGPFLPLKKLEPKPNKKAQNDVHQKAQEMPASTKVEESKPERAQDRIPRKYAPTGIVEEPKPEKARENIPRKYGLAQVEELKPEKAREQRPQKHTPSRLEDLKLEKAHEIPQGSMPSKLEKQKPSEEEIPFKFRISRGKEDLTQKLEDDKRGLKTIMPEPIPKTAEDELEPILVGPSEMELRPMLKVAPRESEDEKPMKDREKIEKERETKGEEGKLVEKNQKMFQEKEIRTRMKTPETRGKEKESFPSKENMVSTLGKGIRHVSASTSKVLTKISERKWEEEEKPMLVNMGAAVLLIAALGVYVSYKMIGSSDST